MSKITKLYGHVSFNSNVDMEEDEAKIRIKHMKTLLEMQLKDLGIQDPHVSIKTENEPWYIQVEK